MSTELHHLSLTQQATLLREKKTSASELAQHYLARMAANTGLNAFLATNPEATLAQAKAADARIAAGETGALLGLPIAHKDVFVTRDFATTAGSKMLTNYRSPFDATVVTKLAAAGMVNLGKLNMDEFAMGSANENSAYGAVQNPWNTAHVPGGSSGGSAAAVAAALAPAATGTDTGGSIRQPAAFCGVTGIKPTYGRVSRWGMIAYASSLDQGGVLAQSAEDCALLLSAMAGADVNRDSTSLDIPAEDFARDLQQPIKGLRVGLPQEYFDTSLPADMRAQLDAALKTLEALGANLIPISLPHTELAVPAYYLLAPAEASSNLSRYDGVKFGHRAADYSDLADMYAKTRSEGFGAEVQRRILIGSFVLSHGYYDAYYVKAQQIRRLIAQDFQDAFQVCDVIAAPVAPSTAWKLGEKNQDPVANYLAEIFTLPASLAGLPCMSLPAGLAGGLPVGLQLIGNYLQEAQLLQSAHQFQQASSHHQLHPAGF